MIETFASLVETLGVTTEFWILIITALSSIIIMAKEFRLGVLLLFFMEGLEFIALYSFGLEIFYHTLGLLITFALLVLTLLISYSKGSNPFGGVV